MKAFSNKTKMAATMVASLAALSGATLAHGESTQEVSAGGLQERVVRLGHVSGFWAANCPIQLSNATAWTQSDDTESADLDREGFAVGVRELLRSQSGDMGVSVALRFRSPAGATADLNRRERHAGRDGYATNFAVPGAPQVRAYTVRTDGSTTVHVAFTRGADEYAIAVEAADGTEIGGLQRALATAASREARRA